MFGGWFKCGSPRSPSQLLTGLTEKMNMDWICKTWICKKIYSEKEAKPNSLSVSFLYQLRNLLSPFIKLFELCIATSRFYSPSLPLSLSRPKYLFTLFVNKYNFKTVYHVVISFQGKQGWGLEKWNLSHPVILQFRIRHDRCIKALTTHLYRVSLDL